MKFQSSVFTRIKLQIIPIILTATFLLLNSTPGEAFWGKKVKEITDDELKEIKTELNLSQDSHFLAYNDSDLEDALNKEMDKDKTPALTFGVYILNAINEQQLVDLCSKSHFNDKDATRFFSALADDLASWQENFAAEVTKTTLEAVIEVSGASGVSIGISSLFLALDLAKIQVGIKKLEEVISNRVLWHYIASRKLGDPHESAWGSAPIPIKYRNKQTEDYFKSLWGRYGKHMSEDGLDEDFKQQQREKLTIFLLYALGAQAHPILTSPLEIAPSAPYYIGDKINAEFTITNKGVLPITFDTLTVGGRDPDDQVADFTFRRDITLGSDESYKYKGTITLPKAGKYHFFCAYQTSDGEWSTSVELGPGLIDKNRVKDIVVELQGKTYPNRIVDILTLDQWNEIKFEEITKYTYKINNAFSNVSIIRTSDNEIVSEIPIGKGFIETHALDVAITPDGKYVYVANGKTWMIGQGGISVIQTSDNTVIHKSLLGLIRDIAITPDGKYIYALFDSHISIIRTSDNVNFERIGLPRQIDSPSSIAITPDGKYIYAFLYECILIIRTSDNEIIDKILLYESPFGKSVITPDGKYVYTNLDDKRSFRPNRLSVIRTTDNTKTDVSAYCRPRVVTPDGKYLYGAEDKKVMIIRTSDNTLVDEIDLSQYGTPFDIAISPDGKYAYATCRKINKIVVIRTSDNRIIDEISSLSPDHVAITPDGKYIYVSGSAVGVPSITVVRTSDNKIIEKIPSKQPHVKVAIAPDGKYVCVSKENTGLIVRTSDNNVLNKISLQSIISDIAITPDGKYVYVIQKDKPTVSVIRTSDGLIVSEIPVETTPSNITITSDGRYVHLSVAASDQKPIKTIKVIRTLDNTIINSVELYSPSSIITPDGKYVYSVSEGECTIPIIRTSDNKIIDTIYLKGEARDIAISSDAKQIYITYWNFLKETEEVAVIAASGILLVNTIIDAIPVENNPNGLGLTPDGKYLYVANRGNNSISVVRISDNTVIVRTGVLDKPLDVAITPDGKYAYVVHENGDLATIRTSDNKVIDTVSVEESPGSLNIAITPDGKYLYLTSARFGSVTVLQISDNRFIDEFSSKGTPTGIAITPDGEYAYVSNYDKNVAVIKISKNKVLQTLPVRAGGTIAITQDGRYAYVAGNDNIWMIRTSDNTIQKTISVPGHPFYITITPDGKYLYISSLGGEGVIVIKTSDDTIVDGLIIPGGAREIICAPDGKNIYVASPETDKVFVIKSITSPR